MLKTRVITAVIGIPLLVGVLYAGEIYRMGLFLIMAGLAMSEFTQIMKQANRAVPIIPAYLLLFALLLVEINQQPLMPLLVTALLLAVFIAVVDFPRTSFDNVAMALFFALYLGVCLSFAVKLSRLDQGFQVLLLAFILTWASDIGGYLAGKRWGHRKLAPRLSPKKTWEGSIGGLVLAAVLAVTFFGLTDISGLTPAYALLLGILASMGAQFGDLFISGIKRFFGVKDSGQLIPGHGGVLDRFDSFLVVAPIVYFFIEFLVK